MRKVNTASAALWTVQGLLAALFLFAGLMKLAMPYDPAMSMGFAEWFLRFIGVAETLGALGLVLPGITRIRTELTSLAAAGLVVIMVGATATTGALGGIGAAAIPAVVGFLCAVVAYKRSTVTVERTALQPAS
jgi:hypothetical protein